MRDIRCELLACLILIGVQTSLHAQSLGSIPASALPSSSPSSSTPDTHSVELERKLEAISSALAVTHQQLEQSQQEMEQLREELSQIKRLLAATQSRPAESSSSGSAVDAAKAAATAIEDLQERQQTTEAQVKVHDQTKVESSSKYPLRVTGLILFNSFVNRGSVDNIDLPEAALSNQNNTTSNGSAGATFRQTILGLQGSGPRVAGARTSADVDLDFFAGLAYSSYATSAGTVRMRTASINFDWTNDSVQAGLVVPLISPLSPTSYAMVAEPALAGAGNLWTWAPQLRYAHQIPLQSGRRLQFEFGLWDPPTAGYSTNELFRVPSPSEASKQPGYESRVSYGTFPGEHPFQIGLSGYYNRQSYSGNQSVDSWAATTDWRVPLGSRFEVSGEGYRGKALGGLGGGVYKNVLFGIYSATGLNAYRGLNAIGGWTQLKAYFTQSLEANASIGLDNGYASDFHEFIFPPTVTATQLRARNKMVFGNLIFRPKTYLILSPEYRRIWTWPIYGTVNTADIFTLSAGYQF
jgi:TolA-binding protein